MHMDDRTVAGRVAAILDAVAGGQDHTPLAKLAAETGIPKPTVRRIANQLVDLGILTRTPNGYRLGLHLIELGLAAASQLGTAEVAAPYVHELHQRTRQIAWVGTVNTDSLVFIDTAFAREHASAVAAGDLGRMPIHMTTATAGGQLVLAARPDSLEPILRRGLPRLTRYTVTNPRAFLDRLQRVAETGVAHEYEEVGLGWWCCATLVPSPTGTYIFGLTAETRSISPSRGIPQLQQIAHQLGHELTRPLSDTAK
jgi:DNA-binding IclR family transcriptional regulator